MEHLITRNHQLQRYQNNMPTLLKYALCKQEIKVTCSFKTSIFYALQVNKLVLLININTKKCDHRLYT